MFNYPLNLSFKLIAFSPQVRVTDATGSLVLYVKQKALALKEDVKIFSDEAQQSQLYQLKADKIIDFSARYTITTPDGATVGSVKRQGMKSLWKSTYAIQDGGGTEVGTIREENPWIKVLDSLVSDIPFVSMFINPAYLVDLNGTTRLYMKKQPAFFEGKFTIEKRADFTEEEERLLLPSVIMMMMLERRRG
ncbi:MAG: hypothetical protein AB1758_15660 [Candidatus Eremiobacterota bacterium]